MNKWCHPESTKFVWRTICYIVVADMVAEMVADVKVNMVTNMEADMVTVMEVDTILTKFTIHSKFHNFDQSCWS